MSFIIQNNNEFQCNSIKTKTASTFANCKQWHYNRQCIADSYLHTNLQVITPRTYLYIAFLEKTTRTAKSHSGHRKWKMNRSVLETYAGFQSSFAHALNRAEKRSSELNIARRKLLLVPQGRDHRFHAKIIKKSITMKCKRNDLPISIGTTWDIGRDNSNMMHEGILSCIQIFTGS